MFLKTLTTKHALETLHKTLVSDGAIIVEGLLHKDCVDRIDGEISPFLGDTPLGEGYFWGRKTRRTGGLFAKSPSFQTLAIHETVLELINSILNPYCDCIQISQTQAIQIEPGEPAQVFHRDDEVFPCRQQSMELMVNVLLALDDFTTTNGATQIQLGSQHSEEVCRDPVPGHIVKAVMPRGSALIYLGSVAHGGGANRSSLPRRALVISYSLGWLKQAENQYLAYPPDVAASFPTALQKLVGYQIHTPNLGWFEGQDPALILRGEAKSMMAAVDYLPDETEEMLKERYNSLVA